MFIHSGMYMYLVLRVGETHTDIINSIVLLCVNTALLHHPITEPLRELWTPALSGGRQKQVRQRCVHIYANRGVQQGKEELTLMAIQSA